MTFKSLFLSTVFSALIFSSGCITTNSKSSNNGIVGLNIGQPVKDSREIRRDVMKEVLLGAVFGPVASGSYRANIQYKNNAKLDFRSKDLMEKIAYKSLESGDLNITKSWSNDYVRGVFEVIGVTNNRPDCRNFTQRIFTQDETFVLNGIACKKLNKDYWSVRSYS